MSLALTDVPPHVVSRERCSRLPIHLYSDASLEPDSSGGQQAIVGGMLIRRDGLCPVAFSTVISRPPPWILNEGPNSFHIGVVELIGVHLAQQVYVSRGYLDMSDHFCYHHVDNQGDCYGVIRSVMKDLVSTSICRSISTSPVTKELARYYSWIASRRNLADPPTRLLKLSALKLLLPDIKWLTIPESEIDWKSFEDHFKLLRSMMQSRSKKKRSMKKSKV
jgi:hypothetical protein